MDVIRRCSYIHVSKEFDSHSRQIPSVRPTSEKLIARAENHIQHVGFPLAQRVGKLDSLSRQWPLESKVYPSIKRKGSGRIGNLREARKASIEYSLIEHSNAR